MPSRGKLLPGAGLIALTLLAAGLGAHRWSIAHVEYYTGDVARTTSCYACHFAARGGTLLDRIRDPRYRSPRRLAVCGSTGYLYVTAEDSDLLLEVDPGAGRVVSEIAVGRRPHGVVLDPDCRTAFVSNRGSDTVSVVDLERKEAIRTLPTGPSPGGIALDAARRRLYVAHRLGNDIGLLDLETGREEIRLAGGNKPEAVAISPDGRWVAVSHLLAAPVRRPAPPAAEVTLIDAARGRVVRRIALPGAHLLEGIAFTPDSDLLLVTLVRPKNLIPVLQVERGWVVTNGFAVIDPESGRSGQFLLDETERYFADPSDVAITADGRLAFVSHGGADAVSAIDVAAVRELLREPDPGRIAGYGNRLGLSRRFVAGRIAVGSNPRGLALSPDGGTLYVAERLDDRVATIDVERLEAGPGIDLGGPRHVTLRRRGEKVFHSGRFTLQQQFSCRSCHPDSDVDGLAYDFEPDGLGLNVVDNRSLLGLDRTGPFKWNGKNTSLYMQCGIRFARFLTRQEPFPFEDLNGLVAYLSSLTPPENRRGAGAAGPTPAQRRGREIFERSRTRDGTLIAERDRCLTCHPPPDYTNRRRENVGSASPGDATGSFDTPHLSNVGNTGPYLHDGKALTLEEIWTLFSLEDTHGVTSDLGKEGLNDLVEFLKTL